MVDRPETWNVWFDTSGGSSEEPGERQLFNFGPWGVWHPHNAGVFVLDNVMDLFENRIMFHIQTRRSRSAYCQERLKSISVLFCIGLRTVRIR